MKLYYLMGKSASGKDTVYRRLLEQENPAFRRMVLYTTRPIRDGEVQGREYHFIDLAQAEKLRDGGKVIEERVYPSVYGPWHYLTVDDGQLAGEGNFLAIGTLDSYRNMRDYLGADRVIPLYLEIDDGIRLERALRREMAQKEPKYEEMCRRFLADQADFSEERLKEAGITRRFSNLDTDKCVAEITNLAL